jgi:NAD(P)H-hydrate repair Nnr-like enzyme with NAD(P)H-hydrate dehydratase domain
MEAAAGAAYLHGLAADRWPQGEALTASALSALSLRP